MNLDYPIRELGPIISKLRLADPQHFTVETWRQEAFKVHASTQCIFLRHWRNRNADLLKLQDFPLKSIYHEPLNLILDELSCHYNFVDYSAIITNLKAGTSIPLHVDNGKIFKLGHRVHIPIRTNPKVIFYCGDLSVNMKLDHAYEIGNSSHMHGVDNNSQEDRYHLIIDLFPKPLSDNVR